MRDMGLETVADRMPKFAPRVGDMTALRPEQNEFILSWYPHEMRWQCVASGDTSEVDGARRSNKQIAARIRAGGRPSDEAATVRLG